jgi:hypothetical protein
MNLTRSIGRPIFGTIALQPLTITWCWWFGLDYIGNMGWYTILATLYLMPMLHWYEKRWVNQEANKYISNGNRSSIAEGGNRT